MPARRLDIASVIERLFGVYAAQFTLIFPAAVLLFLPVAVIAGLLGRSGLGPQLVLQVVSAIATYWLQGMIVQAVRDIQDGRRDFTLGGLFASVTPVLGSLILAGVLASIGVTVGLVLLLVPGLVLLTWWAVLAPVIVIERRPALEAFGRSRELVRGNGWQVFGVVVIVFLIQVLASIVLGAVFSAATSDIGSALSVLVAGALIAPISAIAASLIYLDLSAVAAEDRAVASAAWPGAAPPAT
jgi:hypothetical protein